MCRGRADELCVPPSRVQGYPTIMAFVNGKAAGEYSGERSAGAIKDWALGLVPNHVTTLNKQQQVGPRCVSVTNSHPAAEPAQSCPTLAVGLHNLSCSCLVSSR